VGGGVFGIRGCVYLINGESDAPAAEEQRAPANGWCDLESMLAVCCEN
jgi:hypothetical protein